MSNAACLVKAVTDLEHHNDISIHDCAEPMSHNDGCPLLSESCHSILDPFFSQTVQG